MVMMEGVINLYNSELEAVEKCIRKSNGSEEE
jgi:hypothetical protein